VRVQQQQRRGRRKGGGRPHFSSAAERKGSASASATDGRSAGSCAPGQEGFRLRWEERWGEQEGSGAEEAVVVIVIKSL